jgi:diguanylate cyclase (GGDEF)-like protein/PAS domain S-box-containing protein
MARNTLSFPSSPRGACAGADALRGAEESAQRMLDSIGDAVLSTDLAGNVVYLNPVAERMTGWSALEAYGRPLREVMRIVDGDTRETARDPLALAVGRDTSAGVSANCLLIGRDGRETAIEDTAAPIHDRHGHVTGAVIVFHDVGAARAQSLRMSHLAQHDVLTGLPNRLLLTDRLERAVATACRHGTSLAVLFIDLDGFKRINDRLGHAIGDQVLRSVADRLVASVRRSDTVSRHGGDEFVVLLSEVACAGDAAFTAIVLCTAIAAPYRIAGRELHVTASVGIGVYPTDGTDAETLLNAADLALLRVRAPRRAWPRLVATDAAASVGSRNGHDGVSAGHERATALSASSTSST